MSEPVVWPTLMTKDEYLRHCETVAEVKGWNDALDAWTTVNGWNEHDERCASVRAAARCDCGKDDWKRQIDALRKTVAQREPDAVEEGVRILRGAATQHYTNDELRVIVRRIIEPVKVRERDRVLDAVQGLMARGGLGIGWMQAITDLRKGRS